MTSKELSMNDINESKPKVAKSKKKKRKKKKNEAILRWSLSKSPYFRSFLKKLPLKNI